MGNVQRPEYDSTEKPSVHFEDWMKNLRDDLPLDMVTLPGTSRSMALYGGDSTQAHTWNLEKQLFAGMRAFDIHFLHLDGSLLCFNGPVDQKATFEDVEKVFSHFLKEHQTEFILIFMQEEQVTDFRSISSQILGNKNPVSLKQRKFSEEIKYRVDWADCFWRKSAKQLPTVGDVRGKVVLLEGPYGIPENLISKIPSNELRRGYTVFDLQLVWEQRRKFLKQPVGKTIRVTEIATGESGCYPHTSAKNLNEWFFNEIDELPIPLGVVFFHFPGTGLIKKLIDVNILKNQTPEKLGKGITFGGEGGSCHVEICIEEIRTLAIETRFSDDDGLLVTAIVVNGKQLGAAGGEATTEMKLENGELVSKISGNASWCIESLDFSTTKGNRLCSGARDGQPFSVNVSKEEKLLLVYSTSNLHSICVYKPINIPKNT